jgi:hypothetical protein
VTGEQPSISEVCALIASEHAAATLAAIQSGRRPTAQRTRDGEAPQRAAGRDARLDEPSITADEETA